MELESGLLFATIFVVVVSIIQLIIVCIAGPFKDHYTISIFSFAIAGIVIGIGSYWINHRIVTPVFLIAISLGQAILAILILTIDNDIEEADWAKYTLVSLGIIMIFGSGCSVGYWVRHTESPSSQEGSSD